MARASEREERSFKYQRRPAENIRERANARGGGFDSIVKAKYKILKVRDGKNLIRVLPPTWEKAKHYGYDIWVNYGIGVDNSSYLSLHKMKGEADPLAEARRAAEKEGDKELVKALNPRQRILMWVVDRNAEDEGPQLWPTPISVDKAFAGLSYDEDTKESVFIDDPEEGNDIRFYKEGAGLKTDYPPEKMRILKASPLHEDPAVAGDWLDFIQDNPLPDCLQFYDYDHIAMMFDGTARTESTTDEEAPPRRRSAPAAEDEEAPRQTRRAAVDGEAEGEKPARSGRSSIADPEADPEPEVRPRRRVVEPDPDPEPVRPRRGRAEPEPDPEGDPEPAPRRSRAVEPDPDPEPAPRSSIRDRINRRGRIEADSD